MDKIEVPTPHTGSSSSTSTRSSLTVLESTEKMNEEKDTEKKIEGDERSIGNETDIIWVDWEENE